MPKRFRKLLIVVPLFPLLFASCVGIDADVEFRGDGSGRVSLEYRISRMVESMGKLDGNEAWLPLPVGRQDFERTVARVRGLSLVSFSSKETENDLLVSAVLSFTEPAALVSFLDATGRSASYKEEGDARKLRLRIAEGGGPLDPDLESLVTTVFKGYEIRLKVTTPTALSSNSTGTLSSDGKTAVYTAPVADILSSKESLSWELSWKK